ncbi:MAG: AAA family ATPase [Phycisphaerae bacterium]|nr:AAA family ATPase [Phycisphaerae bacterium]
MPTPPTPTPSLRRELDGTHPLVVIATDDEEEIREQLFATIPPSIAYRRWTAVRGLGDARLEGKSLPDSEHPAAAFTWLATIAPPERSVTVFYDAAPFLSDPRTARALREAVARMRSTFGVIVLVDRERGLPPAIEAEANRYEIPHADDAALEEGLREAIKELTKTRAIQTEIRRSTLRGMVRSLRGLSVRQAMRVVTMCAAEDDRFDDSDAERLMILKRNALGDLGGVLEFVRAPVSLDEIGGLAKLKAWLKQRTMARSDDAEKFGIRPPRGLLLLGVQGAGKSLAAKAIATAWGVPLLRLDASALFDKFVGESERKLRDSLAQADRMAPAVLWIDEIEKGFASAGLQSSDGGLSRRMFGTLLTWMQERTAPTFLAATANDISALPPELLRKGRFDDTFFVDLPNDDARRAILEIHLKKRKRDPKKFDIPALVSRCVGYSGAEIESAIESSLYAAFAADQRELTTEDIASALQASPPLSVVMGERIAELRGWAKDRCVPAD